jgi:hypothetical protein
MLLKDNANNGWIVYPSRLEPDADMAEDAWVKLAPAFEHLEKARSDRYMKLHDNEFFNDTNYKVIIPSELM